MTLKLDHSTLNLTERENEITLSYWQGDQLVPVITIDKPAFKKIAEEVIRMCGVVGTVDYNASERIRLVQHLEYLRDGVDTEEMHCEPVPITSSWRYVIDKALE